VSISFEWDPNEVKEDGDYVYNYRGKLQWLTDAYDPFMTAETREVNNYLLNDVSGNIGGCTVAPCDSFEFVGLGAPSQSIGQQNHLTLYGNDSIYVDNLRETCAAWNVSENRGQYADGVLVEPFASVGCYEGGSGSGGRLLYPQNLNRGIGQFLRPRRYYQLQVAAESELGLSEWSIASGV
jgi:hypothetical protein